MWVCFWGILLITYLENTDGNGIQNAKKKMQKNDIRYIFYTYWNPGLAAFTSTAAGVLHINYKRFFSLMVLAVLVWNAFWGILVYSLGEPALKLLDFKLVLKVIGVWVAFEILLLICKRLFKKNTRFLKEF